ncbi:SAM-dependent methyltransferase [Legionella brunensis]|uniref:Methyltransferase type 11 domain-containing protein n=1 Tax=Legionella brunensis TaxID=29422 RepID=A0A0W0SNW0_9GAMM|nr:class I SAM-dependent methyltransferase [Legionella brunensis]KTC84913.1 hypothetical protein Lbru_1128 [Legionella brunensis]
MIFNLKNKLKNKQPLEVRPIRDELKELEELLKKLGQSIENNHPNINYFSQRFREHELMKLNIKTLGYHIGHTLYSAREKEQHQLTAPEPIKLKSKLCTQSDIESNWFSFWANELKTKPIYHRKIWEFCYIAQALYSFGKLKTGTQGIGFGCGQEPLPSLFAKYGAHVIATDLPEKEAANLGWVNTEQHAKNIHLLRRPDICPNIEQLNLIELEYVDMNHIPRRYNRQFDFCWSSCSLEHLGSIDHGFNFIENSLKTLRPGGVAVHTTEFNLDTLGPTIDNWPTVLYQEKHIQDFYSELVNQGYDVAELDLSHGSDILDGFIDIPPYEWNNETYKPQYGQLAPAHLRLAIDGIPCTSIGLIICKPE